MPCRCWVAARTMIIDKLVMTPAVYYRSPRSRERVVPKREDSKTAQQQRKNNFWLGKGTHHCDYDKNHQTMLHRPFFERAIFPPLPAIRAITACLFYSYRLPTRAHNVRDDTNIAQRFSKCLEQSRDRGTDSARCWVGAATNVSPTGYYRQ